MVNEIILYLNLIKFIIFFFLFFFIAKGQWRPDDGYIQPAKDVGEDWMVVNFTRGNFIIIFNLHFNLIRLFNF